MNDDGNRTSYALGLMTLEIGYGPIYLGRSFFLVVARLCSGIKYSVLTSTRSFSLNVFKLRESDLRVDWICRSMIESRACVRALYNFCKKGGEVISWSAVIYSSVSELEIIVDG